MRKVYLCGISFQHELGETDKIGIYNTLEELKIGHPMWEECGVVELEVEEGKDPEEWRYSRWIVKQNLFGRGIDFSKTNSNLEAKKESDQ